MKLKFITMNQKTVEKNLAKGLTKKLLTLTFVLALSLSAFSQGSGIGVGVILGEPTGLSAKMWTSEKTAFAAAAAWTLTGDQGYIHVHADFLIHSFGIDVSKGQLPVYFGLGGRILLANDPAIGIRVPVGIAYLFEGAPLDAFLEVAPILDLLPSTGFGWNSAIGLRYYF